MSEGLKELVISLKNLNVKDRSSRLNPFTFTKENKLPSIFVNPPCFASIRSHTHEKLKNLGMSLFQIERWDAKSHEGKQKNKLLRWILRTSPWKRAFKNGKKPLQFYLKNGIEMNVDLPGQYVIGAMVALRQVWERPDTAKEWEAFVKAGVSKEIAFVAVQLFRKSANKEWYNEYGTGHICFCFPFFQSTLKAFKTSTIHPEYRDTTIQNTGGEYYGIFNCFSMDKGIQTKELAKEFEKKGVIVKTDWSAITHMENSKFIQFLKDFEDEK